MDLRAAPGKTTSSDEDKASELIREFEVLFSARGNWNNHWTEIAQRILPMHSNIFQSFSQLTTKGEKRNQELYDSTAAVALSRFAAIMDSLLTPRNQTWHRIRPDDDMLMKDKASRIYFDQVNDILFKKRYAPTTNFAAQNQQYFMSLGAYGTGGTFTDALKGKKGLRYKNVHLGELYIQENHQGIVDSCIRHFTLTARQAFQQFGDQLPDTIKDIVQTFPDREFRFLHVCRINDERDPERLDFKGMEYLSYYISLDGRKIVDRGGYNSFPYSIGRYYQAPNEVYGRSPAMDVLPAIKTLNEEKKTMLKQGHRIVDPVLLTHDDGILDSFSLAPGAINSGGVTADGRMLVHALPTGNVQAGKEMMDDERSLINDTFLTSVFQILTESSEMTATEVMERIKEKGILLAPTVGRQDSEYLGPMIHREIDILSRQGALPPMPRMLKSAGGEYRIIYDSPITRSQRAEQAAGALRTVESLMSVAQATQNPSLLDYINWDVAAPQIADINGTPAAWINTKDDIDAIRQSRSQQMQQQQMIQAAPAAAAMVKANAVASKAQAG